MIAYPGTCIGLAVMVNNVETLMYVLIEFIFCLGIPKTPTWEVPEEMDHAIFQSYTHNLINQGLYFLFQWCACVRGCVLVCVCVCVCVC